MSASVLSNLLCEFWKGYKMRGLSSIFIAFLVTSLINSILQEHECWIPTSS